MNNERRVNELQMQFLRKIWGNQNFPSVQILPLRSVMNVCDCGAYDKWFWSALYESGAIHQIFKRFPFADGYLVKWDKAFSKAGDGLCTHLVSTC